MATKRMLNIEEKKRQRAQERADAGGVLLLFIGAAAIVIGLFIGPATLAGCIAGAWALYVLGLISMGSDTATEMRGILFVVTVIVCALGGIGYFFFGVIKTDDAMTSAGQAYLLGTLGMVVVSKLWR